MSRTKDAGALTGTPGTPGSTGTPGRQRQSRHWVVAVVILGALVAAAGFRSSTGALIVPLETEFGWSRTQTSGAVTLNLVVYGLTAPFAAALMERFGIRRIVTIALLLVALGSGLTVLMDAVWQLWALWGILIGVGTGVMALVLGSIVANRWFVAHRGLVTGIFSATSSAGQMIFLPAIATLATGPGWRYAALITTGCSLLLVPLVALVVRDEPADVGLRPVGASEQEAEAIHESVVERRRAPAPLLVPLRVLRRHWRTRSFWILAITFWVCGWSTNGLIGTHFIPAAHDHGMGETTAAGLLALVGIFDMIGTVASGWLTDRFDARLLLACYYILRGFSLLLLPSMLGASIQPNLFVFIVFYGLDWVATVPPTIALCRKYFGLADSSVVFGWVFASHMIGAGAVAIVAGWIRQTYGDYFIAWLSAGLMCLAAGVACLLLPRHAPTDPVLADPEPELAGF